MVDLHPPRIRTALTIVLLFGFMGWVSAASFRDESVTFFLWQPTAPEIRSQRAKEYHGATGAGSKGLAPCRYPPPAVQRVGSMHARLTANMPCA
jgi:hypothetical protein